MSQPSERLLARMEEFVGTIGATLSVPQRRRFAEYAQGLPLPGERKSMEPLAARLDPEHAMARYKTFQRFISVSSWDDHAVRHAGFRFAERALLRGKPPLAWLVDDTGFPKQGKHSVFVQRQYSGTLGKVGNCQIGVSLSVCTEDQSLPLDFELYMPEKWAKDRARRKAFKVPAGLKFRTKPEIALELIERASWTESRRGPWWPIRRTATTARFERRLIFSAWTTCSGSTAPRPCKELQTQDTRAWCWSARRRVAPGR